MKQNNSVFSLKLMRESFHQCRMIGILSLVIMVLGAVLLPVNEAISDADTIGFTANAWESWSANPMLLLAIFAVPLMVLVQFHFLNVRAASDLYHALPHKRISLYLSFAAGILLWVVVLLGASTIASMVTCALTHKYIILLYNTILPYVCSMFLICLLILSGMLLVMSLTGTLFTNMLFTGILLFLPRFVIYALQSVVSDRLPFLFGTMATGFWKNTNNLLFSMVAYLINIDGVSSTDVLNPGVGACVYTLLLALVYFGLGAVAFQKRKSEAAGQSAPSRMHQHIYRILVTMTYSVFVTAVLHTELSYGMSASDCFLFFVLYLVAILIYCVYELITTRKWRSMLKSLPGLGVVAVLNLAILLGLHITENNILSQRPSTEEIQSVSITSGNYAGYSSTYYSHSDYVDVQCQDVKITDETVLSLVSYYLNDNLETWENSSMSYYQKYYGYYEDGTNYETYYVTIKTTDGTTLRRILYIPSEQSDTIVESLKAQSAFVEAWRSLPTPVAGTFDLEGMNYSGLIGGTITQEDLMSLYNTYAEELKSVDFEELYAAEALYSDAYSYVPVYLDYDFQINGAQASISCPVYASLMPKTVQQYYDLIANTQTDSLELLAQMEQIAGDYSISIDIVGENGIYYAYGNGETDNQTILEADCYRTIKPYLRTDAVQTGQSYAEIYIYDYYDDLGTVYLICPLSDDFFSDAEARQIYEIESSELVEG